MTLRHRNVSGDKPRSNSMWEQEASEYWKEMEPAKRYKQIGRYSAILLLCFGAIGGTAWKSGLWNNQQFSTIGTSNQTNTTSPSRALLENDPGAIELLRARCRVRGVQTRWHEETCRKLCIRDPQNPACMNGCTYGSITVTKLTCDQMVISTIPTAQQCPEGVNCVGACRAYEHEAPVPDTRQSCERACTSIVPSSCSRILQIYRDLYRGTIQ